jgi:choloylglycine hydrolase
MVITDNPTAILTNSPHFSWHLDHLRNFLYLSPKTEEPVDVKGGLVLKPFGNGGGLVGLPGDWSSPSRFVRLFFMKHFSMKPENHEQAVNLAFHLLNAMDIPRGVVQNQGKPADYSQWVVVKDMINKKIYFRTYENQMIRSFDLIKELANKEAPKVRVSFNTAQTY